MGKAVQGEAGARVKCPWCSTDFTPRAGGKPQKFCTPACRRDMAHAVNAWVSAALDAGMLTAKDLRSGPAATQALLRAADPAREAKEAPMNAVTEITEQQAQSAGAIFDDMYRRWRAAEERAAALAEDLAAKSSFYEDDRKIFQARIHTLQKQLDDRDQEVHRLQTEQVLWAQERERFVTIMGLAYDAMVKAKDSISTAAVDAIELVREAPLPEPREPGEVVITPSTSPYAEPANGLREKLVASLETELSEHGATESPATAPADDGDEIPSFLRRER